MSESEIAPCVLAAPGDQRVGDASSSPGEAETVHARFPRPRPRSVRAPMRPVLRIMPILDGAESITYSRAGSFNDVSLLSVRGGTPFMPERNSGFLLRGVFPDSARPSIRTHPVQTNLVARAIRPRTESYKPSSTVRLIGSVPSTSSHPFVLTFAPDFPVGGVYMGVPACVRVSVYVAARYVCVQRR